MTLVAYIKHQASIDMRLSVPRAPCNGSTGYTPARKARQINTDKETRFIRLDIFFSLLHVLYDEVGLLKTLSAMYESDTA
jgi:hypothetical protein